MIVVISELCKFDGISTKPFFILEDYLTKLKINENITLS